MQLKSISKDSIGTYGLGETRSLSPVVSAYLHSDIFLFSPLLYDTGVHLTTGFPLAGISHLWSGLHCFNCHVDSTHSKKPSLKPLGLAMQHGLSSFWSHNVPAIVLGHN
jgi:hypothetical protein